MWRFDLIPKWRVVSNVANTNCAITSAFGNSPHFWNESKFQTFAQKFQPEFVVDSFDELSEMSAWLGQRCHYFDEIYRGLGNIIIFLMQSPRAWATLSSF
jgi:hypothetical protein